MVVEFMLRHAIAEHWGDGTIVSSDAMSLDATRHLWNARMDPKRRVRGIGLYTHVLDQWGIIYDQPILLGNRQAGAAIEGAVKQTVSDALDYVAVDSAGYTHFALAVAKRLGFDLFPRVKDLRERRLHIPNGIDVPAALNPITVRDVSLHHIEGGWDQFVRVVASIDSGVCSATLAMQRFGAASRADPIHKAGTALGKLLLTLFLCDLVTNPSFRRASLRILSNGESVHALQRLIYNGGISALHGRNMESLYSISGSLTLLTNIVMAWNTYHMQAVLDHWITRGKGAVPPDILRSIAPVHSQGINLRGEFHFPITKHRDRLMPNQHVYH
jgi:TnpA family transposase